MLDEELLSVWLKLSCVIDNQRLVERSGPDGLSFNEALVRGLLAEGKCRTASQLCAATHILKSQMNAILCALEREGAVARRRSGEDRRQVEVRLLPEGAARYGAAHRRALAMADRLIAGMGEEDVRRLLPLLRRAADIFDCIQQEVSTYGHSHSDGLVRRL